MSIATPNILIDSYYTAIESGVTLVNSTDLVRRTDLPAEDIELLTLNRSKTYQSILGFGGSITEAASYTLMQLSPEKRKEVLEGYFHPTKGHGYTFSRTHINSCDFSLGTYAYCENVEDEHLSTFDISRSKKYVIPVLRAAYEASGQQLKIMATPWSPPAWMKDNNSMTHGGKLLPRMYPLYAQYFVKFIQAYAEEGVPIWAVSVQNEPEAKQVWESCLWTVEEEAEFILKHLQPALAAANLGHIKIFGWDHNKDCIVERSKRLLDNPELNPLVYGIAFHWYAGDHFDKLAEAHAAHPDKPFFFTEGCQEYGPHLDDWAVGERYAHEYIGDLNHGASGFIDWNITLDLQGGPNHVGNYCAAPVMLDIENNSIRYQNSFHYLGQFSRYIQPGAQRIELSDIKGIEAAAFKNPDDIVTIILLNTQDNAVETCLSENGQFFKITLPKRSLTTLLVKEEV